LLAGGNAARASNQCAIWAHDNGMHQPDIGDRASESVNVARIFAMALAGLDRSDGQARLLGRRLAKRSFVGAKRSFGFRLTFGRGYAT
jgi:hypothetical protein